MDRFLCEFDTPDTRRMKANVALDPNMGLMEKFERDEQLLMKKKTETEATEAEETKAQKQLEEQANKKKSGKKNRAKKSETKQENKSVSSRSIAKRKSKVHALWVQMDPDLEVDVKVGKIVPEIETTVQGNESVASSITMEQSNDESTGDQGQVPAGTSSGMSLGLLKTLNKDYFVKLFKEKSNLTDDKKKKLAQQSVQHLMNKYALKARMEYKKVLLAIQNKAKGDGGKANDKPIENKRKNDIMEEGSPNIIEESTVDNDRNDHE